nr:protease inhibitor bi-domain [Schistosoma japonicum]
MRECMIVFFIFAVVSIYYADAESCLYLGQHCNALATKKCCPPFTCKFVNQREGICVREDPGVGGSCLPDKQQCRRNKDCCSKSCYRGNCRSK